MIQLNLKAHPGARDERVTLLPDGKLDVRVRAPALDGRANAAVLSAVAVALGLRPRQVRLLRGERSREKLIEVDLPDRTELSRRLRDAPAR
jgi:uncharacterized protein YggU (UPF0235/DUF167 family)